MESKHTPGPWFVEKTYRKGKWEVQIHGDKAGVSAVFVATTPIKFNALPKGEHATFDKQVANARLIAAAPDLLEALRDIKAVLHTKTWGKIPQKARDILIDEMRQAIRKATKGE